MQKITQKTKAYIFIFLLAIIAIFYFYYVQQPNAQAKCPEDYPETETDLAERKIATDKWIKNFYATNPDASLSDFSRARYNFYMDNDCSATLEKYFEMESTDTETEEEKIIRETIQEEINSQAMKNLINSLKE